MDFKMESKLETTLKLFPENVIEQVISEMGIEKASELVTKEAQKGIDALISFIKAEKLKGATADVKAIDTAKTSLEGLMEVIHKAMTEVNAL